MRTFTNWLFLALLFIALISLQALHREVGLIKVFQTVDTIVLKNKIEEACTYPNV